MDRKCLTELQEKYSCHYKELEAIGLAAPQVTYLVHDLKEKGLDIDSDITTVAEAKEAILALWDKKRKRQV